MEALKAEDFIAEWNDNDRINFLYSAFPDDRDLNAHHYDSKMTLWRNIINNILTSPSFKYCYFTWNDLRLFLNKSGKEPLGLSTVFDDMVGSNTIMTLAGYLQDLEVHETWLGWGFNYVKKPSKWMLNKVLSPLKKRNFSETLILPIAVQNKAKLVLDKINELTDTVSSEEHHYANMNIYEYSELHNLLHNISSDYQSLDIILAYLKSQGKCVSYSRNDKDVCNVYIKFVCRNEAKVSPINEANIGCIQLYKTKTDLENKIHQCYKQIKEVTQQAKEYNKAGKKMLAINLMRKRRRLQDKIQNHEKSLSNVEKLLESIAQCKSDKLILDAYKSGIKAFKDISSEISLDEVEKTRNDIEDVFDLQNDISDAVSSSFNDNQSIYETELEQELKDLLTEDGNTSENDNLAEELKKLSITSTNKESNPNTSEINENINNIKFPDVPTASPVEQSAMLAS